MKVATVANAINLSVEDGQLWLAAGTVRETLTLWHDPDSRALLCPEAATLAKLMMEES
jgi:hypothetical protein